MKNNAMKLKNKNKNKILYLKFIYSKKKNFKKKLY